MGARENRKANYLNIFLHRGVDDHFWRLPKASVNDLHSRVAERPCNNLGASIVAIKPRLSDKYPDSTLHPLPKVYRSLQRPLGNLVKPHR